ncbi:hypothetical protein [Saccharothrix luteola]|uniref:hypothetical protein n=1 Tax=Saccharothrix luteola TaxID=2893018 RepID=UPI001E2D165D|nr:hypothetical protein [Saccharothrix luteola]MCC8247322.1 hypothetical protein [Saccharothrix luteola]
MTLLAKAGGLFKKLDELMVNARQAPARRGDAFVDTLKASQAADLKRIDDFVNRGTTGIPVGTIARDAFDGAKQAVVDGLTGLPRDFRASSASRSARKGRGLGRRWLAHLAEVGARREGGRRGKGSGRQAG